VPSFIKIPPLSAEISHHIKYNSQTHGWTTAAQSKNIMLSACYCWQKHQTAQLPHHALSRQISLI